MIQQAPEITVINGLTYLLDSDIPYTGKHVMFYDSGNKFCEINYVDGKEHGRSISWDKDGRINHKGNSKDGVSHGAEIYWHDNNILSVKGQHQKGKRVGIWYGWHTNGNRSYEGEYRNNERHGLWTYWYSQKTFDNVSSSIIEEQISSQMHYVDGVINDVHTEWYSNGNKQLKENFKLGLKNGLHTRWYSNGHKQVERKYIANTAKNREYKTGVWSYWNKEGVLTAKETYREGVPIEELV